MFSHDPSVSPDGAELNAIQLPNSSFEAALRDLLVIETPEGVPGPVDFRSLGVREFGTIYEGLLESELALALEDLTLDKDGIYIPASKKSSVAVEKGAIYIHNRSGARKSSGSYYTKQFAVEHLLDGALEPALQAHIERLGAMDDTDAASAFFDFRVADISMGSGHFLTAAIDRIEKRLADFLADRNLGGVRKELTALRNAALHEMGDLAEAVMIEDTQLIRRLIARRCIYGVDLNMLSVQLARVAVWIHTFVPGLPLSFLDRCLVHGNSLVGIGTIDEARDKLSEGSTAPLFTVDTESLLGQASGPLRRLANINDATLQDIEDARSATREAREATTGAEALFNLIAAKPLSDDRLVSDFKFETFSDELATSKAERSARQTLRELDALHFPIAFPEVFLRDRPGFDVILGNPPWQEATIEEHAFWARHFPGLRSLDQRDQESEKQRLRTERPDLVAHYEAELSSTELMRQALVGGGFPGMGEGDPDLYKAFTWRFWHLAATDGGRIGVVLPRSALAAKGSTEFRRTIFAKAGRLDATMLVNNRTWVFPNVHPQWSIGLVCITRETDSAVPERLIRLRGPYASAQTFARGVTRAPSTFKSSAVLAWNDSASLPLLPSEDSVEVFAQLRKAPRLDLNDPERWRARPDRELDASNDKHLMDVKSAEKPEGFWPVYKGKSFGLWNPDTGTYYAWADPGPVQERLQKKRLSAGTGRRDSAHREFTLEYLKDTSTLPCFSARVAFRDVSRATDTRTIIACLVPPKVFITNKGPYFLWPRGDEKDSAFLLGVLSSIPLDWYARRFVEVNVNFFIINPFPVPRPARDSVLWKRVVSIAGRLACPDRRFETWAKAVGVQAGPLADEEKRDMIHELDALVARLYGLNEAQLVHIFETFHEGWDYANRLDGVLGHFHRISSGHD